MALMPPILQRDSKFKAAEKIIRERFPLYIEKARLVEVSPNLENLNENALDELCKYFIPNHEFLKTREEKIEALKEILEFRHTKGTAYGYKLYYSFFLKRKVYKASPPYKVFISPSYNAREREEFESLMPEIRVYPFRKNGIKKTFFINDFLFKGFPFKTDVMLRIGDRVELYDPLTKSSTLLNTFFLEETYITKKIKKEIEVRLKGKKIGIFFDDPLIGFLVNQKAKDRFLKVVLSEPYREKIERLRWLSVKPSLKPIRLNYEEERVKGKAIGFYLFNRYKDIYPEKGGSFIGSKLVKSNAEERIYKKFKLFSPERAIFLKRTPFSYLSAMRIGPFLPYTAELFVDSTGKAHPKQTFIGTFKRYMVVSDAKERIENLVKVGNSCTRVADKVLLSITNHRPIRVGEFQLGRNKLGEHILGVA